MKFSQHTWHVRKLRESIAIFCTYTKVVNFFHIILERTQAIFYLMEWNVTIFVALLVASCVRINIYW